MHDHAHGHHHDHGRDFRRVSLSFVLAIAANLGFTLLEWVYALLTGSASLLADAGHNLSDVLGLLLAWGAAFLATRGASELYSYGLRRTTILAAIINAIILLFAAGFIALESVDKLLRPTPLSEVTIMLVAGAGILVNAGTALLFRADSGEDLNIRGVYLHLAYDALISAGVVLSAAAMYFTGWLWLDGLVGLIIFAVIARGAWSLLRDGANMILDAVPPHIDRREVSRYLESIEGVSQVHDLHIWALSTNETCLTAHLVMPERPLWETDSGYPEVIRGLKERFRIHHVTLQVEKDFNCAARDCA